jgi:crotonobetainyl-CoA:carnitine CoA-transferase CaiB-like acyl-CoA transferase
MWAGPLCARVLGLAGAEVVKVEDPRRPDAARTGAPELFRRLHEGHRFIEAPIDSAEVRELVRGADVVLESARPRALPQVGLDREAIAAATGCVWVSITGHGLEAGDRSAFGDDAAVAGGLVGSTEDGPVFCADALADPATGLFAAVGALEALRRGGPWIVDAGLAPCAAELARAR